MFAGWGSGAHKYETKGQERLDGPAAMVGHNPCVTALSNHIPKLNWMSMLYSKVEVQHQTGATSQ